MNIMIASDLHGSYYYTDLLIQKYRLGDYDKLILLGDILYHGPRNDLPKDYNPKKVIELLNSIKNEIIWIQGNCDAEVDQMVLKFPMVKQKDITINGKKVHLEHGHHLEDYKGKCDVLLYGHYHVPRLDYVDGTWIGNPGSISIPKENSIPSYMVLDETGIKILGFQGEVVKECKF